MALLIGSFIRFTFLFLLDLLLSIKTQLSRDAFIDKLILVLDPCTIIDDEWMIHWNRWWRSTTLRSFKWTPPIVFWTWQYGWVNRVTLPAAGSATQAPSSRPPLSPKPIWAIYSRVGRRKSRSWTLYTSNHNNCSNSSSSSSSSSSIFFRPLIRKWRRLPSVTSIYLWRTSLLIACSTLRDTTYRHINCIQPTWKPLWGTLTHY